MIKIIGFALGITNFNGGPIQDYGTFVFQRSYGATRFESYEECEALADKLNKGIHLYKIVCLPILRKE